jgi:hypothetical protein
LRVWSAATAAAVATEAEAVDGVVVLVAAGGTAVGRQPAALIANAAIIEVVVAVVERFTAAVIVVVPDRKATSAFPDKSIQNLFASVRTARSAHPSTLARYAIGRVFWMATRRARSRFVSR